MEAFDRLVQKGKVRTLGASNFDTWRLAQANMIATQKGQTPYTVMQQRLTYLHPNYPVAPKYPFNEITNRERLRFLYDQNMPLVSYSCLCKGGYDLPERLPDEFVGGERLEFLRNLASELGVGAGALVIAWLCNLHRLEGYPRVIPLFSASPRHLEENLNALEINLSDELLRKMTEY